MSPIIPTLKCPLIDENMSFAGIYAIYNLHNGKFYIGSSVDVSKRTREHKRCLLGNYHPNAYLQRAYNKQSKYFIYFLLEKVSNINCLLECEQKWIDELEASNPSIGYNLSPTAGSSRGYKMNSEQRKKISDAVKGENHPNYGKQLPEKTRKKISISHVGLKHSQESKDKISKSQFISVKQIDKEGNVVKVWDSMTTAQNEGGFLKGHISKCCLGKRKTHGGFMWEFA